ncbi:hypothetical protein VTO73DRAFT_9203 [Trametes versicolor]
MSKYIVSKPAGGDALIKSERTTIVTHSGNEGLYAAVDTYLVDTTWMRQVSWENRTDAAQVYEHSYTTELKVTQGTEVTVAVHVGAAFEGLSVGMDASTKTFTTKETTSTDTKTMTITVPPRSTLTFYQRQYTFRATMFFILNAWHQEWNAGSPGGYDIERKTCTVQINSEDYLTTETELTNEGVDTMHVDTVARANNESDRLTRKRENLTEWAKQQLSKMGI